jgi:hypothetical protein
VTPVRAVVNVAALCLLVADDLTWDQCYDYG